VPLELSVQVLATPRAEGKGMPGRPPLASQDKMYTTGEPPPYTGAGSQGKARRHGKTDAKLEDPVDNTRAAAGEEVAQENVHSRSGEDRDGRGHDQGPGKWNSRRKKGHAPWHAQVSLKRPLHRCYASTALRGASSTSVFNSPGLEHRLASMLCRS